MPGEFWSNKIRSASSGSEFHRYATSRHRRLIRRPTQSGVVKRPVRLCRRRRGRRAGMADRCGLWRIPAASNFIGVSELQSNCRGQWSIQNATTTALRPKNGRQDLRRRC